MNNSGRCIIVSMVLILMVGSVASCEPAPPSASPPPTALATEPPSAAPQGSVDSVASEGQTPLTGPEELPSKGSDDAKVMLAVFCDFI